MKSPNLNIAAYVIFLLSSTTGFAVGNGDIGSGSNGMLKTTLTSVYTDIQKECVTISAATEKAPIDFFESDCKAFGGYRLQIRGSDLRYHPVLSFGDKEIEIETTYHFHDTGSSKVEWVYKLETDEEGLGNIHWVGLIFRLTEATDSDSGKDVSVLYVVRLDKEKTCLVGKTQSNQKAREMAYNSKPDCK